MDQDTGYELDSLHQVKGIVEVRPNAANELLEAGWILQEVYLTQDFESRCILLRLGDTQCPQCGGSARVEILEGGERVRFVCQNECHYPAPPRDEAREEPRSRRSS
jgi:hypothetical protein